MNKSEDPMQPHELKNYNRNKPKDLMKDLDRQRLEHLKELSPEELLRELLATLHGDGGHHTERVGLAQSVLDAENKLSKPDKPLAQEAEEYIGCLGMPIIEWNEEQLKNYQKFIEIHGI